MTYMRTVIRPCLAYSTAVADSLGQNSGLRMNVGQTVKRAAVKILQGERITFEGVDRDCKILSDYWSKSVGFDRFLETAIDYMLDGRCVIKLNKDRNGRCIPVASRIDRNYCITDDTGEILHALVFSTFLTTEKYNSQDVRSYWLVEERFYKSGKPYVRYRVHMKSGNARSDLLPTFTDEGVSKEALPELARRVIDARGITLNRSVRLPFRDGLGVWALLPNGSNSCVPGLSIGDPLLYGALDILWAIDCVFSGTVTDVLLGKGKLLVPKKYLETVRADLRAAGMRDISATAAAFTDKLSDEDDSLVYVMTERDQGFEPKAVQFDIRSEKYKGMLEIYLQQLCSKCGFTPTSIFPFLADGSTRTATEVNAEENLTRATVMTMHKNISPIIDRVLNEVLYQLYRDIGEEYAGHVSIKLSDYIGNPIQRDRNTRDNYTAGLIPQEEAVKKVNGTTDFETAEYIKKINKEREEREGFGFDIGGNETDEGGTINDESASVNVSSGEGFA